jgi:hypothetical protein
MATLSLVDFFREKANCDEVGLRKAFTVELHHCWQAVFDRNKDKQSGPHSYLQLAVAISRNRGRVWNWLNGKDIPPTLTFFHIADVMGAMVAEVLPELDDLLARSLCIAASNRFKIETCVEYVDYLRSDAPEMDDSFKSQSFWLRGNIEGHDEIKALHRAVVLKELR